MYNHLVQFTRPRKGYDNHPCNNKPLGWKRGWSMYDVMDDVMPGRDGPESLRI